MRSWTMRLLVVAMSMAPVVAHAGGPGNPTGPEGSRFATVHPRRNEVNTRVERQRHRISAGVRDGKLTQRQAAQLRANERVIKQQEHADVNANGGYLTRGEQRQLNQDETASSRFIYDEKHPAK